MAHTVLARKWRPKKFSDLVGQTNTVRILANIINENRLHHAYLLTGTRGVGKTTIARIIAKALNCLNLQISEPCGTCINCTQIDSGRFVDVIEIDAASNTGVDNIREVIENAQYTPTSGKYKIFIIDEVHMLSKSAFNAMLKTLEEPPEHIVFILATTDPQKVPITVISRCLQLKLRNLSAEEIASHLSYVLEQENYSFDVHATELIAQAANGSMRDALSLTDQAIAFSPNKNISSSNVSQMLGLSNDDVIDEILEAITTSNSDKLISICQTLNNEGANFENVLQQLQTKIFQISLLQLSTSKTSNLKLSDLASKISLQDTQLYFDIINLGLEQINKISQKYSVFTMTLLRVVAFTIGAKEEKELIIQTNNCTVNTVVVQSPTTIENVEDVQITTNEPIQVNETVVPSNAEEIITEFKQEDNIISPPWEETSLNEVPINEPVAEAQVNFTTWLNFVHSLDLSNIPQHVAAVINNFEQISDVNDNVINLNIATEFQPLVIAEVVDCIEKLLFEKYSDNFDLNINFVNQQINNSGSQLHKNKLAEKQAQAELSIENDEIIQTLKSKFSATITPNSIKPL